ncbi:MAG: FAD-dependent oxidoreductase, partial [Terriglobia bacterium]
MAQDHYDLVVIGSGPAGQKGAVAAAKLGKRVALIERKGQIGGVCLHTGTIPSKTLREGILYLTGYRQREFYGPDYTVKEKITLPDLRFRVQKVLERELGVITDQLRRNDIQLLAGTARFLDAHTLEVKGDEGTSQLTAEYVLVACGTRPASCPDIPFDGKRIFLSDQFGQLEKIPRDLIVVGGGVIGLEFASMLTALNINITLIDQRPTILDFVDQE